MCTTKILPRQQNPSGIDSGGGLGVRSVKELVPETRTVGGFY